MKTTCTIPPGDSTPPIITSYFFKTFPDLRDKIEQLGSKWDNIVHTANEKAGALRETLHAATSFWEELGGTTQTIKDLHEQIRAQEAPALEEAIVRDQMDLLMVKTMGSIVFSKVD